MSDAERIYPRRRSFGAFLPFLIGVLEIFVFVWVGNLIGFGWAVLLLIGTSLIGLWLMRRAGFRAWRSLRTAMMEAAGSPEPVTDQTGVTGAEARPEEKIADAGLTLLAGTALLVPGFVTDVAALVVLLPPVRRHVGRRLTAAALRTFPAPRPRRGGTSSANDQVIEGEVIDPGDPDGR